MPALPVVPNVIKVKMTFTENEDTNIQNGLYVGYNTGAPSTADLVTMATAIGTQWATYLQPHYSTNVTLTHIQCTDLASSTGNIGSSNPALTGTGYTAYLPAGTAMLVNFHINRRYRGGHPRSYLNGRAKDEMQDAQTWFPSTVAAMNTNYLNWINAWAIGVYGSLQLTNLQDVSYYSGYTNVTYPSGRVRAVPKVRATALVTAITNATVSGKICSQRRRNLTRS